MLKWEHWSDFFGPMLPLFSDEQPTKRPTSGQENKKMSDYEYDQMVQFVVDSTFFVMGLVTILMFPW